MISTRRIQRLPQVVADAIAAGEVIERPASVVKELMENAIDAGATRIDVDVDGGGLVRIQVADDGGGIAADDLELAVMRHATSKISDAHDLSAIASLGFRGEALASMAAVSDLRIVSRPESAPDAHSIRVRAGEVVERSTTAAPLGTTVEVCELFAATPARLRFLRATATEAAAATRVAADLALAHPEVSVRCYADGRVTLHTPGGVLNDALRAVFGARAERDLVPVDAAGDIHVSGAVSAPHAHRAGRSGLVVVVNGRRVHNRWLVVAVEEAYHGLIPAGRHPFGLLVVALDPAGVDVNVHPAKREVRFADERTVFAAVQRACWAALRTAPARPYAAPSPWTDAELTGVVTARDELDAWGGASDGENEQQVWAAADNTTAASLADIAPLRALGQAAAGWIAAAGGSGVVLVDPHAAHEKVLYSELIDRWSAGERPDSQLLLMPAVVECDAAQMEAFDEHAELIRRCGFELELFGPGMLRCTGVPTGTAADDAARLVTDLLDTLRQREGSPDVQRHRLAALVACHSAVRLGDRLEPQAQQGLLDRLVATPGGMTCPHGRPTVLMLDDAELRRAFRRPAR